MLSTTDNAINRSFGPGGISGLQKQINRSIQSTNKQVQKAVQQSFRQSKASGGHNPRKLLRCVQRANGDVDRMQACTQRF